MEDSLYKNQWGGLSMEDSLYSRVQVRAQVQALVRALVRAQVLARALAQALVLVWLRPRSFQQVFQLRLW